MCRVNDQNQCLSWDRFSPWPRDAQSRCALHFLPSCHEAYCSTRSLKQQQCVVTICLHVCLHDCPVELGGQGLWLVKSIFLCRALVSKVCGDSHRNMLVRPLCLPREWSFLVPVKKSAQSRESDTYKGGQCLMPPWPRNLSSYFTATEWILEAFSPWFLIIF